MNHVIIEKLPGQLKTYYSSDSFVDQDKEGLQLSPEYLNSIETPDLPPHELKLKLNTIVMILRNLNVSEGLCNGTRLMITAMENNVIFGKIVTNGSHFGNEISIPLQKLQKIWVLH